MRDPVHASAVCRPISCFFSIAHPDHDFYLDIKMKNCASYAVDCVLNLILFHALMAGSGHKPPISKSEYPSHLLHFNYSILFIYLFVICFFFSPWDGSGRSEFSFYQEACCWACWKLLYRLTKALLFCLLRNQMTVKSHNQKPKAVWYECTFLDRGKVSWRLAKLLG